MYEVHLAVRGWVIEIQLLPLVHFTNHKIMQRSLKNNVVQPTLIYVSSYISSFKWFFEVKPLFDM